MSTPVVPPRSPADTRLRALCLAALGVVYADIGTSPLYAIRECFHGPSAVSLTEAHVLGVLSLVIWSLLFLVSFMYLTLILRVDNEGEGGILSLATLIARSDSGRSAGFRAGVLGVGLFGAALLFGDGLLTPAISVLSAVEGLSIATPALTPYVVPITILILVALFSIQRRGTAAIGALFGPITLVWFGTLALFGLWHVAQMPSVLRAFDPRYALAMVCDGSWQGVLILGPVFLAITGAETLYADLGHFGRRPIVMTWNRVVLPALLLNYLGQGALILRDGAAAVNPFFHMAPGWLTIPLVLLASLATVIASQGNISEVFSLTRQGVLLGYLPRAEIRHTSAEEMGQIYLPVVNWGLLIATVLLVLGMGSSSKLAGAYGVNVATTVLITSFLTYFVFRDLWGWNAWFAALVSSVSVAVAGLFFVANAAKIDDGGAIPFAIALAAFLTMRTWRAGRELLAQRMQERVMLDSALEGELAGLKVRVPGTAVFLTGLTGGLPPALVQTVRQLHALHERVVFLTFLTEKSPYVAAERQVEVAPLGAEISRVVVRHGYMEKPQIRDVLEPLGIDVDQAVFILGRETLVADEAGGLARWQKMLFRFLSRNALVATSYYGLPPERVLEVGIQVKV